MQRLYSAVLARNEAGEGRHLRRILKRCNEFSDATLLLDDRSTDETANVARRMGARVRVRNGETAWGNESPARAELWDWAASHCQTMHDWVLFADADMEMVGDPRDLIQTRECNSIAFVLYDMWSSTEYRADEYWRGHEFPRIWLVAPKRVPEGWAPLWTSRGIHCGHLPANWPSVTMIAPPSYHWLHWAYSTPELRQQKYLKYQSQFQQMTEHEIAHAESILA